MYIVDIHGACICMLRPLSHQCYPMKALIVSNNVTMNSASTGQLHPILTVAVAKHEIVIKLKSCKQLGTVLTQ